MRLSELSVVPLCSALTMGRLSKVSPALHHQQSRFQKCHMWTVIAPDDNDGDEKAQCLKSYHEIQKSRKRPNLFLFLHLCERWLMSIKTLPIGEKLNIYFLRCVCLIPRSRLQKMLSIPINVSAKGSLVAPHPPSQPAGALLTQSGSSGRHTRPTLSCGRTGEPEGRAYRDS